MIQKIKLTYTDEMKKQDLLWETEEHDDKIMESLLNKIVEEAKSYGFKGYCKIYFLGTEYTCAICESEEEWNDYCTGIIDEVPSPSMCRGLIEELEAILFKENNPDLMKLINHINESYGCANIIRNCTAVSISKVTPNGQSFDICVDIEDDEKSFVSNIRKAYNNFDIQKKLEVYAKYEYDTVNKYNYDILNYFKKSIYELYTELKSMVGEEYFEDEEELLEEALKYAEELGWNTDVDKEYISLQKYSPAGQDFSISIEKKDDIECFINNIYDCYDSFDVSYETYLWLDSYGHGRNGAPYNMRDLYNDMEACEKAIYDLYLKLKERFL